MVRWYHLILSAYGFWLPNDPRGSWSDFIGSYELLQFGGLTTVNDKRNYARDAHDRQKRLEAKRFLKYPPVRFNDQQRNAIVSGFAAAISEASCGIPACCIGYDHVHMVVERHERTIEAIAIHLKAKATMSLRSNGCHPLARYESNGKLPTPWARDCWSVFINEESQYHQAINYVRRHPMKEGLAPQNWPFLSSALV